MSELSPAQRKVAAPFMAFAAKVMAKPDPGRALVAVVTRDWGPMAGALADAWLTIEAAEGIAVTQEGVALTLADCQRMAV